MPYVRLGKHSEYRSSPITGRGLDTYNDDAKSRSLYARAIVAYHDKRIFT